MFLEFKGTNGKRHFINVNNISTLIESKKNTIIVVGVDDHTVIDSYEVCRERISNALNESRSERGSISGTGKNGTTDSSRGCHSNNKQKATRRVRVGSKKG